jgi:hypothetical protein
MNVSAMSAEGARQWNASYDEGHAAARERYAHTTLATMRAAHTGYRLTLQAHGDHPFALGALVAITSMIAAKEARS